MAGLRRGFWSLIPWALVLAGCSADDDTPDTPLERQIYLEPTPIATPLAFDRVAQG